MEEVTCICCPLGCNMKVAREGQETVVTGHSCYKGERYARQDATQLSRIITTTVPVIGGDKEALSVKTEHEIKKGKIFSCMRVLKKIEVKAPVQSGDVVLENIAGTGVRVIAVESVSIL